MQYNTNHLAALMQRLSNETDRHGINPNMAQYLNQIKKEIKNEEEFLAARGIEAYATNEYDDMSMDDLLNELIA